MTIIRGCEPHGQHGLGCLVSGWAGKPWVKFKIIAAGLELEPTKPRFTCQWPRLRLDPFVYLTALEEAEIIPGKDSDTRIKPLALTNGHGRYMTVTPERTLASVKKCPLNI
jgi:hypothetical protein